MARPTSRRGALKLIGATAAAATAATLLRPFRSGAVTCPAGSQACGQGCCPKGGTCTDPATSCCCPKETTPCGTSCCNSGVACQDRSAGLCGCPAGTTPCGSGASLTCCPAGQACGAGCPLASSLATAAACVSGTTSSSSTSTSSSSTSSSSTSTSSSTTTTTTCTALGQPCTAQTCCSGNGVTRCAQNFFGGITCCQTDSTGSCTTHADCCGGLFCQGSYCSD